MRIRTFSGALLGAIAAAVAFTAAPSQIIFASSANAEVRREYMKDNLPFFFYQEQDKPGRHCQVNVWGHLLDC